MRFGMRFCGVFLLSKDSKNAAILQTVNLKNNQTFTKQSKKEAKNAPFKIFNAFLRVKIYAKISVKITASVEQFRNENGSSGSSSEGIM